MFTVNEDMSIYVTRGDVCLFSVTADDNGETYVFKPGDVVRMKVTAKKNCDEVVLQKDFPITIEQSKVDILLTEEDTKIGGVISKPVDYWYEIELNPFTNPQTIIGYDDDGAKIFKLFPEGKDLTTDINKEEIPVVDRELDLSSERPLQNQAITRAMLGLTKEVEESEKRVKAEAEKFSDAKDMLNMHEARLNALASLDEGSTTGDAELIDGRTNANGYTHENIGAATRRLHEMIMGFDQTDITIPSSLAGMMYLGKRYGYYSIENAINDINSGNIGASNEEADISDGLPLRLCLYTNSRGIPVLELASDIYDITTPLKITKNMILNLNGNTLYFGIGGSLEFTSTVTRAVIDGRINGSAIKKLLTETGNTAIEHLVVIDGSVTIKGGTYKNIIVNAQTAAMCFNIGATGGVEMSDCDIEGETEATLLYTIQNKGVLRMSNCKVKSETIEAVAVGLYTTTSGRTTLTKCNFEVESVLAAPIGINNKGTTTMTDCEMWAGSQGAIFDAFTNNGGTATLINSKIFADSVSGNGDGASATGILSTGNITIKDCEVYGTFSGVCIRDGSSHIDGGIYEGVGHGGFYFNNPGGTSYIEDAIIRNTKYVGRYKNLFDYDTQYNVTAFYVGGGEDYSNISVYIDNCEIDGGKGNPFVLRGTDGEQNNAVYLSNCKVSGDGVIRIDNDTLKLYVGKHNNVTAEMTNRPTSVITTDSVYFK